MLHPQYTNVVIFGHHIKQLRRMTKDIKGFDIDQWIRRYGTGLNESDSVLLSLKEEQVVEFVAMMNKLVNNIGEVVVVNAELGIVKYKTTSSEVVWSITRTLDAIVSYLVYLEMCAEEDDM